LCANAREIASGFLKFDAYPCSRKSRNAGGAVNNQNATFADDKGFTTEDILWAVGIWSVILGLSPVIVFYMLMVG
jgi:hypothetical protein